MNLEFLRAMLIVDCARPVETYHFGTHEAVLLDVVHSAGPVTYRYIFAVFEKGQHAPSWMATSENNAMAEAFGGGSHFLCAFEDGRHVNMGSSDEWADRPRFTERALELAADRFDTHDLRRSDAQGGLRHLVLMRGQPVVDRFVSLDPARQAVVHEMCLLLEGGEKEVATPDGGLQLRRGAPDDFGWTDWDAVQNLYTVSAGPPLLLNLLVEEQHQVRDLVSMLIVSLAMGGLQPDRAQIEACLPPLWGARPAVVTLVIHAPPSDEALEDAFSFAPYVGSVLKHSRSN